MRTTAKSGNLFERLSALVTKSTGSTTAFIIAFSIIVTWILTGPIFNYSDTWQLVINTGTTIVTFLMVFLIQRSQNKDALVIQIKLNELIASSKLASNKLIDIEALSEDELLKLEKYYKELLMLSKSDKNSKRSHSIEEARELHKLKSKHKKKLVKD